MNLISPLLSINKKPVNLRCEYLINPLGIDVNHPRFSWTLNNDRKGARQTAYRIFVSTDSVALTNNKANVWDTGKVISDKTNNIKYEGKELRSRQRYFWKVIVWDKDRRRLKSSNIASWETALFKLRQWKGNWISDGRAKDFKPAPYFRKDFQLKGKIKKARIYISGLGYYLLNINGKRVGTRRLDPAFTNYNKTVMYNTYDVTKYLKNNQINVLGVILGNGWYNEQSKAVWNFDEATWRRRPRFLLNMYVEYENGQEELIKSDTSWKTSTGPIIFNNIYSGEYYDNRKDLGDWNQSGYVDTTWTSAQIVPPPGGTLKSQLMPSIRIQKELKPLQVKKFNDSTYVFDFGQNFAGWSRLQVKGKKGTVISLKHGEALSPGGRINNKNISVHYRFQDSTEHAQTDKFILSGDGTETFTQHFTYHGFRYIEVTSSEPILLDKHSLTGLVLHTDLNRIGHFTSSNPLLNKIYNAGIWSYDSNIFGIPTDCPQREKNGWTGDGHIAAEVGLYNYASILFYEKWINDFADAQWPTGELPGIIPTAGWGYDWGNGPAWDSGFLLIPWYLHLYYKDDHLIHQYYKRFKKYVEYLRFRAENNITYFGLGDWAPANTKTPASYTSTCYYYVDALLLSKFAAITGRKNDLDKYAKLARQIKQAINKKYLHKSSNQYANGSQTALSAALYQGIVPDSLKDTVAKNLVENVRTNENHLDVGLLSSKYLLNALTEAGYTDVAYKIATQKTRPSWGWWIEQGLTTFQEGWGIGPSRNHIFKGEIVAWMVKALSGINPDPKHPGFKQFILHPHFIDDLSYVEADYQSIHGLIQSEWRRQGKVIQLSITIPANTQAKLILPNHGGEVIYKDGRKINKSTGFIGLLKSEGKFRKYMIKAGKYHFFIKNN